MCKACDYTIHGAQHHFGWDNTLAPAQRVAPGSTIEFHCHDSSAGQLGPSSTLQSVVDLDFGKINPVRGLAEFPAPWTDQRRSRCYRVGWNRSWG